MLLLPSLYFLKWCAVVVVRCFDLWPQSLFACIKARLVPAATLQTARLVRFYTETVLKLTALSSICVLVPEETNESRLQRKQSKGLLLEDSVVFSPLHLFHVTTIRRIVTKTTATATATATDNHHQPDERDENSLGAAAASSCCAQNDCELCFNRQPITWKSAAWTKKINSETAAEICFTKCPKIDFLITVLR